MKGATAAPHRANRVDDMTGRQIIAGREPRFAGGTAAEPATFFKQAWTGGAMDRAINPAAAKQRGIGGVHDRIDCKRGDVGNGDLEPGIANLAAGRGLSHPTGCWTAIPLPVNSACSSPAWNISRTMSQPPTNSPLT